MGLKTVQACVQVVEWVALENRAHIRPEAAVIAKTHSY